MMMVVMVDKWISGSVASDSVPNLSKRIPNSWDDHCLDFEVSSAWSCSFARTGSLKLDP